MNRFTLALTFLGPFLFFVVGTTISLLSSEQKNKYWILFGMYLCIFGLCLTFYLFIQYQYDRVINQKDNVISRIKNSALNEFKKQSQGKEKQIRNDIESQIKNLTNKEIKNIESKYSSKIGTYRSMITQKKDEIQTLALQRAQEEEKDVGKYISKKQKKTEKEITKELEKEIPKDVEKLFRKKFGNFVDFVF